MDIGAYSRVSRFRRVVGVFMDWMGVRYADVKKSRERANLGQIRVIKK